MTKEIKMRLFRIFNIILGAYTAFFGLELIVGCLYIYYGVGEYTREAVATVLALILPTFVLWALLAIFVFVFELCASVQKKPEKPERDLENTEKKLLEKKNIKKADPALETVRQIKGQQRKRKVFTAILLALTVIASLSFLFFALQTRFYGDDINRSVIWAFSLFIICFFDVAVFGTVVGFVKKSSLAKEIELLKRLPDAKESDIEKAEKAGADATAVAAVLRTIFIVSAAVALIIGGIVLGGYSDVLTKAVNICTECIGLG